MKFIAISQNTGDPTPFLEAEGIRAAELQQSGVFERVLVKADWSGAVILLEADDDDAARAVLTSMPMVVNGVTSFTLIPVVEPPNPSG